MLLTVQSITKAFGPNDVLRDVSLHVDRGERLGLVGANGSGKSTLIKIIAGPLAADSGVVRVEPGAEVGYLPQALTGVDHLSVNQLVDRFLGGLRALQKELHALEASMARAPADLETVLADYGRLTERFERRDGYALEHRLDQVFQGLGLAQMDRNRRVGTLSGGEKSRVGLAALLIQAPDLLLLDEPTNHLDFAALAWLEEYLAGYRGGVLVVSHDRHFLNRTVTAMVEIDEHSHEAKHYAGSYDFYAEVKTVERRKWEEAFWAEQEEMKQLRRAIAGKARQVAHNRPSRDNEKFAYTAKGERVHDAISRNVRAAEEKLRRIQENPVPKPPRPLRINPQFDPQTLFSRSPVAATGLVKHYGRRTVLDGLDFALQAESRVALVGPNGAGKSTLLRLMAGLEQPDAGEIHLGGSAMVGYLDQEQENLPEQGSILEAYCRSRQGDPEELKAELLGYGLFSYAELLNPVATASVGQKRKLQIALLIAQRANLLLLDEPTNHISLDVLEQFEQALLDFPGPVVAVSHDRYFLRRFRGEIWALDQGRLRRYLGGWDEYVDASGASFS